MFFFHTLFRKGTGAVSFGGPDPSDLLQDDDERFKLAVRDMTKDLVGASKSMNFSGDTNSDFSFHSTFSHPFSRNFTTSKQFFSSRSQVESSLSCKFHEDLGHFLLPRRSFSEPSFFRPVPGVSQEVGQREGASPEGGPRGPGRGQEYVKKWRLNLDLAIKTSKLLFLRTKITTRITLCISFLAGDGIHQTWRL